MRKLTHSLCILTGALALGAGACSSGGGGSTGGSGGSTGNGGGSGNSANPDEILLNVASTGYVMDTTTNIVGAIYAYGDSAGPNANTTSTDSANSDCVLKGHFTASQCSQIAAPIPGQPFNQDASGGFCTTGTAAVVLMGSTGAYDYSDLWGAGMGVDLNNPGGDAGVKGTWDGSAYAGVAFDIAPWTGTGSGAGGLPAGSMRVNFPFTGEHGTDSPYYKGATNANSGLPMKGGHVRIKWTDVGGPSYLANQTPPVTAPAFDPTKIQSVQWQVFTNTSSATPYSFCVSNLAVIKK